MRPEQDAYGALLYDIHANNADAGEIVEREDGFITYSGSAETYFKPYSEWTTQVQEAIKHAHKNVVDIGCGAGRHSLYLQNETDCTVRAVDVSPKAVTVTQERGVERTSVAGIDDVSDLQEAPYNTILLLGNNLGLLGTKPVQRLQALANATTDDAVIIGQTRRATQTDTPEHLQYHEYNKTRGRRPGCIRLRIRYKQYQTDWYDYLYLDEDELQDILDETVWTIRELYGDDSPMYTVVLEKEA